jgi:dTDP-4-dehydrorhamnose 3,5-epimerase
MEIINTKLPGVLLLKPTAFGDRRGFFYESFQAERYCAAGLTLPFVQDNHSSSCQCVLR